MFQGFTNLWGHRWDTQRSSKHWTRNPSSLCILRSSGSRCPRADSSNQVCPLSSLHVLSSIKTSDTKCLWTTKECTEPCSTLYSNVTTRTTLLWLVKWWSKSWTWSHVQLKVWWKDLAQSVLTLWYRSFIVDDFDFSIAEEGRWRRFGNVSVRSWSKETGTLEVLLCEAFFARFWPLRYECFWLSMFKEVFVQLFIVLDPVQCFVSVWEGDRLFVVFLMRRKWLPSLFRFQHNNFWTCTTTLLVQLNSWRLYRDWLKPKLWLPLSSGKPTKKRYSIISALCLLSFSLALSPIVHSNEALSW